MSQPANPPAGWYPDPAGQAGSRYWDGARWTTHTQPPPGAAPAAPTTPAPPQPPVPSTAPSYAVPPPPATAGAPAPAPPAPASASASAGLNGFVDALKRLEPFALVLAGGVLFLVATVLPWVSVENLQTRASDSVNAWSGDGGWLIFGSSAEEALRSVSGTTDMIILFPLALAAVGIAWSMRSGKTINHGREITAGAAGLLTLLLIIEIVHVNGVVDDLNTQVGGRAFDGGATWGLYIAVLTAGVMTFGAVRGLLEAKAKK